MNASMNSDTSTAIQLLENDVPSQNIIKLFVQRGATLTDAQAIVDKAIEYLNPTELEELVTPPAEPVAVGINRFGGDADTQFDAISDANRQKTDALSSVPAIFKTFPNWVTWESPAVKGPRISGTSADAKSNDPNTWVDYETACANIAAGRGFSNLGFVTDGERAGDLTGIDLDGCRNPETGELMEWAKQILAFVSETYIEVTPSKKGLRAWIRAKIPSNVILPMSLEQPYGKKQQVEVFGDKKYFTMTGDVVNPADVRSLTDDDVAGFMALLHGLSVKKSKPEKHSKRAHLVHQEGGLYQQEDIPPDKGFKKLFDVVGWKPLMDRMNKMRDARFHDLEISPGHHSVCPMPGHTPRGEDIPYTDRIFGAVNIGDDELVHCYGCDFTGDLVSTIRAFDGGEDGGQIQYETMYDCARPRFF
jgi:hypothetical protein